MSIPTPIDIKLLQKSRVVEVVFDDQKHFVFTCEFLRVHSPSAEVRGHGVGEGVLVTHKENVNIVGIDPIGNYAVKFIFDDGHNTGIYSWQYLYDLGVNQKAYWQHYKDRLSSAQ